MATGLPVVATDVGGNPELVIHGNTGMLVPPSDPVAMADALSTYLHDPMLMHRHGQAGRKRVERKFSMDRMVARYMAMYDGYLTSRCRSSLIHGVRKG
jgi:glycosyltransferase involved in cell wall biosynthesis